ncbi:protein CyaY [mine drainage metagenome]|uniref:Protein CyaY n=1 Tax=mine drainage metagenome TaxID=410659 RepID=A0A1J5R2C3_9ZZZZ
MDEREFNGHADAMLAQLEAALEQCGADLDFEMKPGGVLEIEFAGGSKIIVNRHTAAREIWVAAKSGGYHFKREPSGRWIASRDGEELLAVLARCIAEQSGTAVTLG